MQATSASPVADHARLVGRRYRAHIARGRHRRQAGRLDKMKRLYTIAYCMFVVAIACRVGALIQAGRALEVRARAITLGETDRALAKQKSDARVRVALGSDLAGLTAAGLGIAAWIGSMVRARRSGNRLAPVVVIPSGLLLIYVMLSLVMV